MGGTTCYSPCVQCGAVPVRPAAITPSFCPPVAMCCTRGGSWVVSGVMSGLVGHCRGFVCPWEHVLSSQPATCWAALDDVLARADGALASTKPHSSAQAPLTRDPRQAPTSKRKADQLTTMVPVRRAGMRRHTACHILLSINFLGSSSLNIAFFLDKSSE